MSAIGELISALFGWIGSLAEWIIGWVPNYEIIRWNERGVKYPAGHRPFELSPHRRSCPTWLRWLLLRNVLPGGRRLHLFPSRWLLPIVRMRGIHWYCPNLSEIETHHISRMVLIVESLPLETKETEEEKAQEVEIGMVLTYHIVDVCKYEVENYDADESMSEAAQGAMADIVTNHTWSQLQGKSDETSRLGKKLRGRMDKGLERFGVEVETCRPTEQIRLRRGAMRLFGVAQTLSFGGGS